MDAVRGASEACDQSVGESTLREQMSEATKKCVRYRSPKACFYINNIYARRKKI